MSIDTKMTEAKQIKLIKIGTKNEVKVSVLKDVIRDYPLLAGAAVSSIEVPTEVSEQPKSLEETISGAKARAKNAFSACDLSFGIEDGLMKVPGTLTGYMNICVCAVYDVENYYLGISSAFEYPEKIVKILFREGLDVNQAFFETGLTKNKKIGSAEGAVAILTRSRWRRADTIKQSIISALISFENKELYYPEEQ